MSLLLGVDAGNHSGKVMGMYGTDTYLTTICEWFPQDIKEKFGEDDMEFEIGGRRGFAGTIARYEDEFGEGAMYGDTKAHEDTKIRVLLAIYRYIEKYCPGTEKVSIVTGQPIVSHNDGEKSQIVEMLKGEHSFEVNGRRQKLEIVNVIVGIEGSSSFWGLDTSSQRGKIRIIDVGSGTINCATIVNGKHISRSSGTFNYGTETMSNIGDVEVLSRGVLRSTTQLNWGRDDIIYVCGGVAEDIIPFIKARYPKARVLRPEVKINEGELRELEPKFANSVGYYELAKELLG